MKTVSYPERQIWPELLARPAFESQALRSKVAEILGAVRIGGDAELKRLTREFDGVELAELRVGEDEFAAADLEVGDELKDAIDIAIRNIDRFHSTQIEISKPVETTDGVFCWRKSVPIERVGLYVPAGTAPLFSTVLMLAVPARLAGCAEIVLCSPPDKNGRVNSATLYAAGACGITEVFKIGGAQAIAAMAFGTESVPRVFKIFGPGNQFVTEAKLQASIAGTAIDMPAGPSEVAILADGTCVPEFVAADLLSQAEHGPDSQVLLVSTDLNVINATLAEIDLQIESLPRKAIALESIRNSTAVLVEDTETAVDLLNEYAPEHLILAVRNADEIAESVTNAGSVFIGNFSCEAAGDYASGTNHTLPTNGFARAYSGVSLDSFVKKITFQKLTASGIRNIGPAIETMAEAENLRAHRNAVSLRLKSLANEEMIRKDPQESE
ncbi:MAG: histidinol dehydrogenase [Acidobacteria bacterium]|nr:histidinol dehydrogenase [Acidobacteriota bacterium]